MDATSLDLHYDAAEDRLVLTAHGTAVPVSVALTRRLTRDLLSKTVELLMLSSAEVSRAPAQHRETVLLFEFASALAEATERPMGERAKCRAAVQPSDRAGPPAMAVRGDLRLRPSGLDLGVFDLSGLRFQVCLTRAEVHRLLDLMIRLTQVAEWRLEEVNWIDRRRHLVVPEQKLLS